MARTKRDIIDGLETGAYDNGATLPDTVAADRTANTSGEGVDVSDDFNLQYDRTAPLEEEHSDEEEPPVRFTAIEMDATQLLLAQREVGQDGAELATIPFGLQLNASIGSYHGHPHDLALEANAGDRQAVYSPQWTRMSWSPCLATCQTPPLSQYSHTIVARAHTLMCTSAPLVVPLLTGAANLSFTQHQRKEKRNILAHGLCTILEFEVCRW